MRARRASGPGRRNLTKLEEPYHSRAAPPGTARYWSWLFATRDARAALLGVYALLAEWRALMDPRTDIAAARIKLEWWHAEMRRLASGQALHPISRYLADLPGAQQVDFTPLVDSVEAVAAQLAGAPVETAAGLPAHAMALYGIPLQVVTRLMGAPVDAAVSACTGSLAQGEYLARALAEYRAECHIGRVPFAVDELLAARVDNEDLAATVAPPHLQALLDALAQRAAAQYSLAAVALSPAARAPLRHLLVIAELGQRHVARARPPSRADLSVRDLYNAWRAAQRAGTGA